MHQQCEGFVQLCVCHGAWLPAALGHSTVPVADDKWGQRSLCCLMGLSNEYQLEKKAQQNPRPADQKGSEGGRESRNKLMKNQSQNLGHQIPLIATSFQMAKSPRSMYVKDAVARKNLGTVCYMDKPVPVFF